MKTLASVWNPSWKYVNSKDTDIRKTFAKHGFRRVKRRAAQYFTTEELAESRAPLKPVVPRGWASTDLTPQEFEEAMREMARDYQQIGDPYAA